MASTDYDYTLTRTQIIQRAFSKIGVLADGETLTNEQLAKGVLELNSMVKSWQAKQVFLWSEKSFTVTLAASTASYALPVDPPVIYIYQAYLRESNDDHPVEVVTYNEYLDIPDKTDSGDPILCAVNYQETNYIYVWPVPTASGTLFCVGVHKLKDWDSASSAGDFPVRWIDALTYGLCAHLADDYGLPLKERDGLQNKAEYFFDTARRHENDPTDFRCVEGAFST